MELKGALEKSLRQNHGQTILGVDEVGRGCIAGPLFAAAISLNYRSIEKLTHEKKALIRDSKTLSARQRRLILPVILGCCHSWGVAMATTTEIEEMGITNANFLAMKRALSICQQADFVIVDGKQKIPQLKAPQMAIIKGDQKTYSIAAASIVAKTNRDDYMVKAHQKYPSYGFKSNMGYGTKEHISALRKYGACSIHRKNFAPVRDIH